MSRKAQRRATRRHRRRAAAQGLVRLELQARVEDAGLIRALAETLRGNPDKGALRSALSKVLPEPEADTAFDIFGSELADEAFTGIFDRPRRRGQGEGDL